MKPISRFCIIVFALFLLLCPLGCASFENQGVNPYQPDLSSAISALLSQKEQAVTQNDLSLYLSTLSSQGLHPTYEAEQRHWFADAVSCGLSHYSLRLVYLEALKDGVCRAIIEQSYQYRGKTVACELPMTFSIEQSDKGYRAKDLGYAFLSAGDSSVRIYYAQQNASLAQPLLQSAQRQNARLKEVFSGCNLGQICINLYPTQQQMRTSIKPSIPSWTGGWTEPGESIKLFFDPSLSPQDYETVLAHELTHLYTFSLCKDHAAYWLTEGLAGLMEQSPPQMTDSDLMLFKLARDAKFSLNFDSLSQIDYESLTDRYLAGAYYAACKLAVNQLFEDYGIDGIITLLQTLGHKRVAAASYGPQRIKETSALTRSCMQEAGMDPDVFRAKYNARLNRILEE